MGGYKDQILGLIRHVVTFVGGILVGKGKLDPGAVETLAGIVATVAGFILSMMAPEKTLTPEKIIATMEPSKTAAVANILAQPEPAKNLTPMAPTGDAPIATGKRAASPESWDPKDFGRS